MAFLWSNPTPDDATSAKLSAGYKVDAPSIGALIAAIIGAREAKSKADQQSMNDLMKGIGNAAGGVSQAYAINQSQGQSNDAANAAMYGMQYPNDQYGGFSNPNKVPDYGGVDAMQAMKMEHQMHGDPLDQQYKQAQIDAMQALAHDRWTYPNNAGSGDSGTSLTDQRRMYNNYKDQVAAAKQEIAADIGKRPQDVPQELSKLDSYQVGVNDFPAIGTHPAIPDASQGEYKDRVLNAAAQYRAALHNMQHMPSDGTGNRPAVPEGATPSNATSTRAGSGPPDAAIAHLKSHPELAKQFDEYYGAGMAAQFLGQ